MKVASKAMSSSTYIHTLTHTHKRHTHQVLTFFAWSSIFHSKIPSCICTKKYKRKNLKTRNKKRNKTKHMSICFTLSLIHSLTQSISPCLIHSHTLSLSVSVYLSHYLPLSLSSSLSFFLSHTHIHKHTHFQFRLTTRESGFFFFQRKWVTFIGVKCVRCSTVENASHMGLILPTCLRKAFTSSELKSEKNQSSR